MMNTILLGLTALLSTTGVSSCRDYSMTKEDFQCIVSYIGGEVTQNKDEFYLSFAEEVDSIYTIYGENRYYEVELKNGGYLIYDKKESSVLEYSSYKNSPYKNYNDTLKILYKNENEVNHIVYEDNSFYMLEFQKMLSNSSLNALANSNKDEIVYYSTITPGKDAVLIPNSFYFEHLRNFHGLNEDGICSVIASQILFGYLDTFYNDDIVDEKYDKITSDVPSTKNIKDCLQSPGTGEKRTDQRFRDFLVQVATDATGKSPTGGMNTKKQTQLVKKYLNDRGMKYNITTSEGNFADVMTARTKKLIKSAIDEGYPVIANGKEHSTVAYGYDDNYVYVHTGWGYVAATSWDTYSELSAGAIQVVITSPHRHSDNYYSIYHSEYYCPDGYTHYNQSIDPEDYGFENAYYFNEITQNVELDNFTLSTTRLRTGYIEEEYINLSSRKENVNEAFLEYHLKNNVKKISVNISFWSAKERFFTGSSAHIDYLDQEGKWIPVFDLLHDINLSTDRYNQNTIIISFPENVSAFRFYASNEATGDRNKGRISIGHLEIFYDKG